MTDRTRPTCAATTAKGEACRGTPLPCEKHCFAHSPRLEHVRAEARRRGGENSSTEARALASLPTPIAATLAHLQVALVEVHTGQLPPARAQAMASCARAIIAAWDVHVVEARLDEVEEHLAVVAPRRLGAVSGDDAPSRPQSAR